MMKDKVTNIFRRLDVKLFNDKFQRFCYFALILLSCYLSRRDISKIYDSNGGLFFQYILPIIIPVIIFTIQILYNNFIVWALLFTMVILSSAYKLYKMALWQIETYEGNYYKTEAYQTEEYINYLIIFTTILFFNVLFFKLNPNKNKVGFK